MRNIGPAVAIAVLLVFGAGTGGLVVAAESEYDMSIVNAVETPTETVEIEGSEYEIDHVGVIDPGDPIEVEVTSAKNYYVLLYNADEKTEHRERMVDDDDVVTLGDADDDLDTASLEPGTYMLSLEPDDEGREAVAPVVVQGYDITLDYPTTAMEGSDVEFEATVEPISDLDQPDVVEVAIWDGTDSREITLDQTAETSYGTTVSLETFETGTYDVYGSIDGEESAQGYPTALAVESGASLTVTAADETDDGDDANEGDGDDETGDGESDETDEKDGDEIDGENGDEDRQDADTSDEAADDGDTGNDDSGDGDTGNDDSGDGDTGDGDTNDTDDESSDVIEPNETSDEADPDESPSDDELGTPVGIAALVAISVVLLSAIARQKR